MKTKAAEVSFAECLFQCALKDPVLEVCEPLSGSLDESSWCNWRMLACIFTSHFRRISHSLFWWKIEKQVLYVTTSASFCFHSTLQNSRTRYLHFLSTCNYSKEIPCSIFSLRWSSCSFFSLHGTMILFVRVSRSRRVGIRTCKPQKAVARSLLNGMNKALWDMFKGLIKKREKVYVK